MRAKTRTRALVWTLAGAALAVAVAGLAAVRLVPSDPAVWHVDVASVVKPASPNAWLVRDGGDAPALRLDLPPAAALARLRAVALAWPRTAVLAEDAVEDGAEDGARATFITRTALVGWPDYTTVQVAPIATGSVVMIFARSRFGYSDLGVNEARVRAWIAALER